MADRCKAIKPDGTRCTRKPSVDSEYCWQHQSESRSQFEKWLKRLTVGGLITVALGAIGFYSDMVGLGFPLPAISDQIEIADQLEISRTRRIEDAPTSMSSTWTLSSSGTVETAIVSHYWQIFLSNNGDNSISVIDYNLVRVEDEESPALSYSGMDQGIFMLGKAEDLEPVKFPINIEAGESIEVFVRIGLIIHPLSYQLIKESDFGNELNLVEINKLLRSHNLDLFGNQLEEIAEGAGYRYPAFGEIKDETFRISFKTSRQYSTDKLLSWYHLGGLLDELKSNSE